MRFRRDGCGGDGHNSAIFRCKGITITQSTGITTEKVVDLVTSRQFDGQEGGVITVEDVNTMRKDLKNLRVYVRDDCKKSLRVTVGEKRYIQPGGPAAVDRLFDTVPFGFRNHYGD